MITKELIAPKSIVVVGASNNISKPGGKLLKNLIDNNYMGELWVVNPGSETVQGIKSYASVNDLPPGLEILFEAPTTTILLGAINSFVIIF